MMINFESVAMMDHLMVTVPNTLFQVVSCLEIKTTETRLNPTLQMDHGSGGCRFDIIL